MPHRCDSCIINYLTSMTLKTPEMTRTKSKFRSKFRFRLDSVPATGRNFAGILNLVTGSIDIYVNINWQKFQVKIPSGRWSYRTFSAKFPILSVKCRQAPNVQCCIMYFIVKIVTRTVVCTHLMMFLRFC